MQDRDSLHASPLAPGSYPGILPHDIPPPHPLNNRFPMYSTITIQGIAVTMRVEILRGGGGVVSKETVLRKWSGWIRPARASRLDQ